MSAHPLSVVLIMGVTSSGKSTVGEGLAERLGWVFRDADSFHPPENVAKMSSGQPLNDDDRKPWLQAIAHFIDEAGARNNPAVVTCSALKRAYREVIVGSRQHVALVRLDQGRGFVPRVRQVGNGAKRIFSVLAGGGGGRCLPVLVICFQL